MEDPVTLLVYVLATWRLASLLVDEAGPGHVFQHLREFAGIEHEEDGKKTIIPQSFFGELLSCVWCMSIWAGTFWMVFALVFPEVALWVATVFALSAGAIVVQRVAFSD